MEIEREDEFTRFSRIFSVDPGLFNIGLCILDSEWRILELRRTELSLNGKIIERQRDLDLPGFLEFLTDQIELWLTRYVLPRIPLDDSPILFICEENSDKLVFTRDWCGILSGILLSFPRIQFKTVYPPNVSNWLRRKGKKKGVGRFEKKRFTMEYVMDLEQSPLANVELNEHSADACVNAIYIKERFF